jgi:hypothetical protein
VRFVLNFFLSDIASDGSAKQRRIQFLLRKLVDEALEEMGEVPPEMIEFYFQRAAHMMYWGATGQVIENLPLPNNFKPPAELCEADVPQMSARDRAAWAALESPEYADALKAGQAAEMAALEASVDE